MASSVIIREDLVGEHQTLAVQDHQGFRRGGVSGVLLPTPFTVAKSRPCSCVAARRGRGTGQVQVTGTIGHDRSGSGRWLSRRATAGIAYLLARCGGLMLERAGADARATAAAASRPGASMVTTLMMVPVVCADDAGGPAPCRLAGAAEATRSRTWPPRARP